MAYNLLRQTATILKNTFLRRSSAYENVSSYSSRGIHLSSSLGRIISFNLSDIGEGIREVTIKEWYVKVGDNVEQFQNICEVQSDKASVVITSRYDGVITKLYQKIDEVALVGSPLVDIDIEDTEESPGSSNENNAKSSSTPDLTITISDDPHSVDRQIALATPAVRRIARENNVDLRKVPATGKGNRVLKGDILEYLGQTTDSNKQTHVSASLETDRVEPLRGIQRVMFKSMSESLKIPHFGYSDEVDMTRLTAFRDQLQDAAKSYGISKLTFMPFCIKSASIALKMFPILNSSLDVDKETVTYKNAHNISIAIGTPAGLVVPNIKNCQHKSIFEIAKDLNKLIECGRAGTLAPEDFLGGTFALSNIGNIGGTYTHPCIMPPQVSIGAMGRTKLVPRFNDQGDICKAYIMNVSWTADHRVIDGVTMASFSNVWKKHLENPALFLLSNM